MENLNQTEAILNNIKDGYEIEFQIVNHCNLNCAGCNHYTAYAEEWYMSLDDFTEQLKLLTKIKIRRIMILGGEPTLHPQLLDFCKIARKYFPKAYIDILSNGVNVSNMINDIEEYKANNITMAIFQYSGINYNRPEIKQLCDSIATLSSTRPVFMQSLVDENGTQDKEKQFYLNCPVKQPCLTIKDYKIFNCPCGAHINQFNANIKVKEKEDYLDLKNFTEKELIDFVLRPKNICSYCRNGDYYVWHQSIRDKDEHRYTLFEMYEKNYPLYLTLIDAKEPIQNKDFFNRRDPVFAVNFCNKIQKKFDGALDIIIPYYNLEYEYAKDLHNSLKKQTIIDDCVIYLIDDGNTIEKSREIRTLFNDLNCVFLKNEINSGPGVARNNGIQHSYNELIYFLDADDYLIDPDVLEKVVIDMGKNKDYLLVKKMDEFNFPNGLSKDYCVRRRFLQHWGINFGKFYYHEDAYFNTLISIYSRYDLDQCITPYVGSFYRRSGKNRIGNSGTQETVLLHNILSKFLAINQIIKNYNNSILLNYQKERIVKIYEELLDVEDFFNNYSEIIISNPEQTKKFILYYFYILNYMFLKLDFIKTELNWKNLTADQLFWANMINLQKFSFKLHEEDNEINDFKSLESFFISEVKQLEKRQEFSSIFKQIKEEFLNVEIV